MNWKRKFKETFCDGSDWKTDYCDECGAEHGLLYSPKEVMEFIEKLLKEQKDELAFYINAKYNEKKGK